MIQKFLPRLFWSPPNGTGYSLLSTKLSSSNIPSPTDSLRLSPRQDPQFQLSRILLLGLVLCFGAASSGVLRAERRHQRPWSKSVLGHLSKHQKASVPGKGWLRGRVSETEVYQGTAPHRAESSRPRRDFSFYSDEKPREGSKQRLTWCDTSSLGHNDSDHMEEGEDRVSTVRGSLREPGEMWRCPVQGWGQWRREEGLRFRAYVEIGLQHFLTGTGSWGEVNKIWL